MPATLRKFYERNQEIYETKKTRKEGGFIPIYRYYTKTVRTARESKRTEQMTGLEKDRSIRLQKKNQ